MHLQSLRLHPANANYMWSQVRGLQGVYGWRAHPAVRAYRAFKRGEAPPEPEAVVLEPLSASAGRSELAQLGLHM